MRIPIALSLFFAFNIEIHAQGCCSGGSGSPIAGGASQGVLQERQMEVSASYQYLASNKFMVRDRDTTSLFDNLCSNYMYGRLAYGITNRLTMSVESGYFINKKQVGLNKSDVVKSGGIGDLLFFPRYSIYTRNTEKTRTEITLGMGVKIPLGKYNDSTVVFTDPKTGQKYYTTDPPTVQPTNGSHDFVFYGFVFRGYPEKKFRVFSNILYIKKRWNPLGEKFGDYASIVDKIISASNGLNIGLLINNAGYGTSGLFIDNSVNTEINMLRVNCEAVLSLSHYFAQKFKQQSRGGIIFLSSLVAFQGVPYAANYAASKAYIQSFSEALTIELKPYGVDVLAAAPGPVDSGFGQRANMQMGNSISPQKLSAPILKALGKQSNVIPGLLSKVLVYSLRCVPRFAKIKIMKLVMGGFTEHQRKNNTTSP